MENSENKNKEEINVGDYVKVVGNLYIDSCDGLDINIYGTIAQVMYKLEDDDPQKTCVVIRLNSSTDFPKGKETVVLEKFIVKVELDDEIKKQMFGNDVIDENACKKMHDFCYGKEALKDVKTAMEAQGFEQVTSEMRELYKQKNHDYGNSFGRSFQKYGLISAITRMSDKWERIDSLCQKQAEVKYESIRDTLIDLANYCVMTIMELDKKKADSEQKES